MILPLIFGLGGAAILAALGTWQVQRLQWKEGVLAEMRAELGGDPVALPASPQEAVHNYLPVRVTGEIQPGGLHFLTTRKGMGPGYRVVSVFETADGRRVMLDRGFLRETDKSRDLGARDVAVTGNLHWPDEYDESFTPDPDIDRNIWFARQVGPMADYLGTEPLLVVARRTEGGDPAITPWPVDTSGIPNDHLQYAVTWFSLMVLWLGMTAYLLWRIRRRTV